MSGNNFTNLTKNLKRKTYQLGMFIAWCNCQLHSKYGYVKFKSVHLFILYQKYVALFHQLIINPPL